MVSPLPLSQYQLIQHIASGSYGSVYKAKSLVTSKLVAIKTELTPSDRSCMEGKTMLELQHIDGIPRVFDLISTGDSTTIVMELLGSTIEQSFQWQNKRLSCRTVCQYAVQMIAVVQKMHNSGYVHRDIKPENFVFGRGKKSGKLHLIDFGLSKRFQDRKSGVHIGYREDKGLTGTALFASVNSHMGIELSRRDDLESLAYVLVYLSSGKLPWEKVCAKNREEKYEKIGNLKEAISVEEVCKNSFSVCATMLSYVKALNFTQKPNYEYLVQLFQEASATKGENWVISSPTVKRRSQKRRKNSLSKRRQSELPFIPLIFMFESSENSECRNSLSMHSEDTVENGRLPTISRNLRNVIEEHSPCEGKKTVDQGQCTVW